MKTIKRILFALTVSISVLIILYLLPERTKEFKTLHFTFHFTKGIDTVKIQSLARALEANYHSIGRDLKTTPAARIETNVYANRWRYIKATGNWGASGSIEGISKLHFIEQAWGETDVQKVAVHEFAHTVTLKLLLDQETPPIDPGVFDKKFSSFPVWLWEAISVHEARQFVDPSTLAYFDNGQYPSLSELNDRLKGGKIYSCGYTIVEFIVSKYGQAGLIELIGNYGDLGRTFGVTDVQFCKDWYQYLEEKYLNPS